MFPECQFVVIFLGDLHTPVGPFHWSPTRSHWSAIRHDKAPRRVESLPSTQSRAHVSSTCLGSAAKCVSRNLAYPQKNKCLTFRISRFDISQRIESDSCMPSMPALMRHAPFYSDIPNLQHIFLTPCIFWFDHKTQNPNILTRIHPIFVACHLVLVVSVRKFRPPLLHKMSRMNPRSMDQQNPPNGDYIYQFGRDLKSWSLGLYPTTPCLAPPCTGACIDSAGPKNSLAFSPRWRGQASFYARDTHPHPWCSILAEIGMRDWAARSTAGPCHKVRHAKSGSYAEIMPQIACIASQVFYSSLSFSMKILLIFTCATLPCVHLFLCVCISVEVYHFEYTCICVCVCWFSRQDEFWTSASTHKDTKKKTVNHA